MNFETVKKKNSKKKIIIGIVVLLILTSVVMFVSTRAKYKNVQSIKLANGTIDYKAPDLKIAIKVSEDGENYTSQSEIPTGDYILNTAKSKCRIPTSTLNGENAPADESVTIEYVDGKLNFRGLTHNDTKCYVYFDKVQGQTSSSIIAAIEASSSFKTGTPTFSTIATTDEGIYKVADGMYSGYSYYWRGTAPTNHVIFDNKCWRIVRINGDKSIRLIYNGTPTNNICPGNGNSSAVIMGSSNAEKYYATSDGQYNNSSYVGWTYTLSTQRTTGGTASNAKTQTEKWYNSNISAAAKTKVDTAGKFCNDRNVGAAPSSWGSGYTTTWSATGTQFAYAARRIIESYAPTLSCPSEDVYTLSVGAITADEVMFAGGKQENNTSYYLYTGQSYWTMSPSRWSGAQAFVFYVDENGHLPHSTVSHTVVGLRSVINLKADTLFAPDGNGTANKPYVVS